MIVEVWTSLYRVNVWLVVTQHNYKMVFGCKCEVLSTYSDLDWLEKLHPC